MPRRMAISMPIPCRRFIIFRLLTGPRWPSIRLPPVVALWTHTSLSLHYQLRSPRICLFENGLLTQTGLLVPPVRSSRHRRALESTSNTNINRLLSSVYVNPTPKFPGHAMVSEGFVSGCREQTLTNYNGSFHLISPTLSSSSSGPKSWSGEPGYLQNHWRAMEETSPGHQR